MCERQKLGRRKGTKVRGKEEGGGGGEGEGKERGGGERERKRERRMHFIKPYFAEIAFKTAPLISYL